MSVAMYRLILLTLYISATLSAPQNSNITYVVPHTDNQETLELKSSSRDSRIENIPLTIPNSEETENQAVKDLKPEKSVVTHNYADIINSEIEPKIYDGSSQNENVTDAALPSDNAKFKDSEYNVSESKQEEIVVNSDSDISAADNSESTDVLVPAENIQTNRQAKIYETSQDDEGVTTESDELGTANVTDTEEPTKAPSPREISLSKLSYFSKPSYSSFANNLINGRRKFKSKCRCEKIWRCAKLQITVPRCPEEYFMCCS